MDKVIDIQNWTRKEEYLFFSTFLNPMISVTVEVDCTTAYRKAKERQQPFSLYYMHAAVTAANRIEGFFTEKEIWAVTLFRERKSRYPSSKTASIWWQS